MSCGVGCRHSSDLMWLWLWCRLAALAPIRPLAWEPPHATVVALKKKRKEKVLLYGRKVTNKFSKPFLPHIGDVF